MMKRYQEISKAWILSLLLLVTGSVLAQNNKMYVWQYGQYTAYDRTQVGKMNVNSGYLDIQGERVDLYTVDSITFTPPVLDYTNKVVVKYEDNKASVLVPENISGVTYTVQGAHVVLTSTNITEELEYVLEGNSTAGSLLYYGDYKCKFYLNGLNLTSNKGAAVDIQCGKRIEMILQDGKENFLKDAAGGTHKAALNCDGHMEFEGGGSLTVAGKTGHAIRSNEYSEIKRSTGLITVTEAVKDGFHCGQYFKMNGGKVVISGVLGDGIQAEVTNNILDEHNGELLIEGGEIDMIIEGVDIKGLKADADMTISGGTIKIQVRGNGSKGISTNGHFFVNENDAPTLIDILATGGPYTDPATGDVKKCMGIKIDFNMTVTAGTIKVVNTGAESTGIDVAGIYTVSPEATVDAQVVN